MRKERTRLIEITDEALVRRIDGMHQLLQFRDTPPSEGKSYHILTNGNIDLLSVVMWLMTFWQEVDNLFLSAWTISYNDLLYVRDKIGEGSISKFSLILGDVFKSRYKTEWKEVLKMLEEGKIGNVYLSKIHSKIVLFQSSDGKKVVVESSANCNMNPRMEQHTVTVSSELYEFYLAHFEEKILEEETLNCARNVVKLMNDGQTDITSAERASLFWED